MKDVEVVQVIRTRLLRRGDGKTDPVRIIEQYWTLDGDLITEKDPLETLPIPDAGTAVSVPPHHHEYVGGKCCHCGQPDSWTFRAAWERAARR